MRTVSTKYSTKEKLHSFIKKKKIPDDSCVLLQVFTSVCDEDYINKLLLEINTYLPNINIIGSSTNGELIDTKLSDNAAVLSFSVFDVTTIEVCANPLEINSYKTASKLIKQIPQLEHARLALVFADGLHTNGEVFLNAFNDKAPHLKVAGGLSADDMSFNKTFVFTKHGIVNNGAVCAVFYGEKLILHTAFSSGWETVGKELTITKAKENRVYTIDSLTAVEIYAKYLGQNIKKLLPAIGIEFPLIIERDGKKIPRSVISKEEDGSLIFAGNINTGDKVWFGYGNVDHIIEDINNLYASIANYPIESIFIYSCMARKKLLGDKVLDEIYPLTKIAHVSGFFTYGEFFHDKESEFLNETMTLLTLSENDSSNVNTQTMELLPTIEGTHVTGALSHLIFKTTQELRDVNENLKEKVLVEVEKNRQKDQQVLQQSRLAQMGEMLNMIAHQWRQPLNTISATSNDLIMKVKRNFLDEEYFDNKLNNIEEQSQYLSKTIDDFRGFYKEDKEKVELLYSSVVKAALSLVSISIENKNIEIKTEYTCKNKISIYKNELMQVILNLIKNAEDILLENNVINPYISIKTYDDEKYSYLHIEDNGGGVPEVIIHRIFEPYFSTKKEKDGTGLGLYMSKVIIEDHFEGCLRVFTQDNITRFIIQIPIHLH